MQNKYFFNPFLGHFQKLVTGSESMCRSVMASSFQKWSWKEGEEGGMQLGFGVLMCPYTQYQ